MKARVQVLSSEHKAGRSKTGADYALDICQCVVHEVVEGGEIKLQVGELVLPKDHPQVKPGMYDATFGISVDQNKRIGGRLLSLHPVPPESPAPSSSGAGRSSPAAAPKP